MIRINTLLINEIKNKYPDVRIIAATKYVDSADLMEYYHAGIKDFGENRVDQLIKKQDEFQMKDIKWHFIGHLQSNKCHLVINRIDYLHSLDSYNLVKAIDKYAKKEIECFIEVNTSEEENKNGIKEENLLEFIKEVLKFGKIKIIGLMTMAVNDLDQAKVNACFKKLYELKKLVNQELKLELKNLSMGMSNDYPLALDNHTTHLRLGRILIDERKD